MAKQVNLQKIFDVLSYNPDSGEFIWVKPTNSKLVGKPAGYIDKSTGYVRIYVDGQKHYAHRLAIAFLTGALPTSQVDHKDGNRSNNKAKNLRSATCAENQHNRKAVGAYLHKQSGKWVSQIRVNYDQIYLGIFNTRDEARNAYLNAKKKYHVSFSRE